MVEEYTILVRSANGVSFLSSFWLSFSTGTLSPVSEDSSTVNCLSSNRRISAGTIFPSSK